MSTDMVLSQIHDLQGETMPATVTKRHGNLLTIELDIELGGSMLDMENQIQDDLNHAGRLATAEVLKQFDTDGSPMVFLMPNGSEQREK